MTGTTPRTAPPARSMERAIAALPDALTGLYFLSLWLFPLMFGPHAVRNGMLLMLVEFLLLHASIFLGNTAFSPGMPRAKKVRRMGGFAVLYGLFIGAWALAFEAWWPLLAFAWLLAIKFSGVFGHDVDNAIRLQRLQNTWAIGTLAYVGGVLLTTLLWVPRLGITSDVQTQLGIPGNGLWVDHPQKVIAFGCLYFGTLALTKWRGWRLPDTGKASRQ